MSEPQKVEKPEDLNLTPAEKDKLARYRLLSHARAARWELVRIKNLGLQPSIGGICVDAHEVTAITCKRVVHDPDIEQIWQDNSQKQAGKTKESAHI